MAEWSGSLSFRQRRLFVGRADLFRPSYPVGSSGGLATTYVSALTNVPYVLDRKQAVDSPAVLGAIEGTDLLTTDTARFPPGTELGSGWIVVDRSITILGDDGQNHSQGWTVLGDPVKDDDLDNIRRAGAVEAYLTRLPRLPDGIE